MGNNDKPFGMSGGVREAIVAGLKAFAADEPDFTMSRRMREAAADYIIAQPGLYPTPTPPIEGRDADAERVARAIDAADNDWIEDYPGSPFEARVTPKWSEAMARAALQALGERG